MHKYAACVGYTSSVSLRLDSFPSKGKPKNSAESEIPLRYIK